MRQRVRNVLKILGLYGVARRIMDGHRRRQKVAKMRAFYRQFIAPNDLVFDIGANVGNYTAILLSLGARTLSVEPQADCMAHIKARFGNHPRARFYLGGVADKHGELELHISNISETSSFSPEWIERLKDRPGWESHRWDATQKVPVTTLDALIAEHGVPTFIKIDVEGFELHVLQGLSQPVQALSFEYSPELPEKTAACMAYLLTLGNYEFNAVHKEAFTFLLPGWTDAAGVAHLLEKRASIRRSGDVYARLKGQ